MSLPDLRAKLIGAAAVAWAFASPAAAQVAPPSLQPAAVASGADATACRGKDLDDEAVDAAAAACGRALSNAGSLTAAELHGLRAADADLQLRRRFPAKAEAQVKAMLAANPADAEALLLRARLHELRAEGDAALTDIAAVLKADARNVDALLLRANYYRDAFDQARARTDYEVALQTDPLRVDIWKALANLASWTGKEKESVAAMDLAAPHLDKVTALRLRGIMFENLEQPKKAQAAYDAALKLEPRNPVVLVAKATLLKDVGKAKDALALCDAALVVRPRYGLALRLKAQILVDQQDWNGAAAAAQAAADAFTGDIDARVQLAAIDRRQAKPQPALALAQLTEVLKRDPTNSDAQFARAQTYASMKRTQEAIDDYTRVIAVDDSAAARYNRGQLYASLDDHAKAAADFQASARMDPKDVDAPIQLGLEQSALKQPQAELASYHMALDRDPGNAAAMANLAISYADLDDCKQAIGWYEKALRKAPKRVDLHRGAVACDRALGRDSDADRHVQQGLQIDAATPWAWIDTAERLSARGRTAQALDAYSDGLKHSPKDLDLLIGRGKLYEKLQDYTRAGADLDSAVAAAPQSGDALNARGLFHWRRDDNDLAIADFDRLIKLGDEGEMGYYNSGLAWRDKGRYDQALRQFNAYLKRNPDDTDALLEKAYAYKNLEDFVLAIEYFDAVIRIDPKLASAWSGRAQAKKALGDPTADADSKEAERLGKKA